MGVNAPLVQALLSALSVPPSTLGDAPIHFETLKSIAHTPASKSVIGGRKATLRRRNRELRGLLRGNQSVRDGLVHVTGSGEDEEAV